VRKAKATTRSRCCSDRCRSKVRARARPSRNPGSTAWLWARAPRYMSTRSAANAPLISGSMTRFPYRRKNHGSSSTMAAMMVADTR
jgi:hypothetical protein